MLRFEASIAVDVGICRQTLVDCCKETVCFQSCDVILINLISFSSCLPQCA